MSYNYLDAVTDDVRDFLDENFEGSDYVEMDADELRDALNDDLWTEDSVTGNGSGSYTFDRWKAREYVLADTDAVLEALTDFGVDAKTIGEKFLEEDWEYFDVTARCYVLGQAIDAALEERGII